MFLPVQRASLILLFFLFTRPGLAQFEYREIRHATDTNLVFPVFAHANKKAAKNINEFLQMDFFETTIYHTPERKLFDDSRFISDDSAGQSGYTLISYEIQVNNSKILSVSFRVEGMGASPPISEDILVFILKLANLFLLIQCLPGTGLIRSGKY